MTVVTTCPAAEDRCEIQVCSVQPCPEVIPLQLAPLPSTRDTTSACAHTTHRLDSSLTCIQSTPPAPRVVFDNTICCHSPRGAGARCVLYAACGVSRPTDSLALCEYGQRDGVGGGDEQQLQASQPPNLRNESLSRQGKCCRAMWIGDVPHSSCSSSLSYPNLPDALAAS